MREGKYLRFPLQHGGADVDPWSGSSRGGGGDGGDAGTASSAALAIVKMRQCTGLCRTPVQESLHLVMVSPCESQC